jgi:SAM-dependent methyltransferase
LDLGCGSGNVTLPLAKRGYEMIGIDVSADMLATARGREGGENILWLCQDMRSFELYGTVEAVVCTLDGINHLTKKEDVSSCFRLVHNYLVPNGVFVFDVNSPYKFREVYGNRSYILEDEGVLCAWQNAYNEKSGLCRFDVSLFEEQEDGSYLRGDATVKERCYKEKALCRMLADAGFSILNIFDGYSEAEPKEDTERLVIVAKAKK